MPKSENQKLKLLYLMKMLLEETDEEHVLTVPQIIEKLGHRGIRAERKSVYSDIGALRSFGLDVVCRRSKTAGYFVAGRTFELPELKLLADAVASSKFLTEKKSAALIRKIEGLASVYEAKQIQRQVYVRGRVKTMNEKIYYNVDTIHQAIARGRQIVFRYFEYVVQPGPAGCWQKRARRGGEAYVASPYAMTWDDENYYMIAFYERRGTLAHFRVDKMENVEILEEKRRELPDGREFDLSEYLRKLFGMFGGEEERITLQFDNSLIGVVLDRFGKNAEVRRADADSFYLTANAFISPTLLGWIFEFGAKIRILEPESLIQKLRRKANESLSQYGAGSP